jgi:transcriptional regulator with XRE-family HTH domain
LTVFYKKLIEQCSKAGISPSAAATKVGLTRAAASGWKKGSAPSDTTRFQLAAVFGLPENYFDDEKEPEEQKENLTVQMDSEVDDVTMELLGIINSVTNEERQDMLEILRIYKRKETKKG